MLLDLSHSLEILSHAGVKLVGNELSVLTVSWILLSVQEPLGNVVVGWSRDDVTDLLNLIVGDFTGSLVTVDLSDLQREE